MNTFSEFQISAEIVKSLDEMGYHSPTEVQKKTLPPALEKRDLIVLSKTGSGKTGAFGVPMIELLSKKQAKKALVLAPTRELAVQVETELGKIAKHSKIRAVVVYGKHSMNVEIDEMKKGFQILVGTPGRVLDHIEHDSFDPEEFDLVVLDEADRMLDMGFIDQVAKILSQTAKVRTTYLFSATIPEEIVSLSAKYLVDPVMIELESDVKTVELVKQYYYHVTKREKRSRLFDILMHHSPDSCIIFANTRFEVDRLTDFLVSHGITAKSIHGANSQTMRLKFLEQFKKGGFRVLVATDVAARGLHIEGLEMVINYDLPVEKDSYIHRIGRTGRAGKDGKAFSMVAEGDLYQLYEIEEHAGVPIEELELPPRADVKKSQDAGGFSFGFKELRYFDPNKVDEAEGKSSKKSGKGKKGKGKPASTEPQTDKAISAKKTEKPSQSKKAKAASTQKVDDAPKAIEGVLAEARKKRKRNRRKPNAMTNTAISETLLHSQPSQNSQTPQNSQSQQNSHVQQNPQAKQNPHAKKTSYQAPKAQSTRTIPKVVETSSEPKVQKKRGLFSRVMNKIFRRKDE